MEHIVFFVYVVQSLVALFRRSFSVVCCVLMCSSFIVHILTQQLCWLVQNSIF